MWGRPKGAGPTFDGKGLILKHVSAVGDDPLSIFLDEGER